MNEKLQAYLKENNAVSVASPEDANQYLGDLDVIIYAGIDKDAFREVVGDHKPLPLSDAKRYKEYRVSPDVVLFASQYCSDIVDRIDNPQAYEPVPQEAVEEPVEEPVEEAVEEPVGTTPGPETLDAPEDSGDETPPESTTWF
tara:strand:+ start:20891 stop:21319 length:429 start_codon:yes stop_codon:yes gene_type:complete